MRQAPKGNLLSYQQQRGVIPERATSNFGDSYLGPGPSVPVRGRARLCAPVSCRRKRVGWPKSGFTKFPELKHSSIFPELSVLANQIRLKRGWKALELDLPLFGRYRSSRIQRLFP
jgi:hypothetical protein